MQSDYMDADVLQHLIDGGFSLGFHGHQHRPQFLDSRFQYGGDRRITVISAGTLCGNASFRFGRAYNIVELDTEKRRGKLHLREMQNDRLDFPIWGRRALHPGISDSLSFEYDAPPDPPVRASEATTALISAQALFDAGDYLAAVAKLQPFAPINTLARRLLAECLNKSGDALKLIESLDPPRSATEAIYVMDALWQAGHHDRLSALLAEPVVAESTDPSVVELKNKYLTRLRHEH